MTDIKSSDVRNCVSRYVFRSRVNTRFRCINQPSIDSGLIVGQNLELEQVVVSFDADNLSLSLTDCKTNSRINLRGGNG